MRISGPVCGAAVWVGGGDGFLFGARVCAGFWGVWVVSRLSGVGVLLGWLCGVCSAWAVVQGAGVWVGTGFCTGRRERGVLVRFWGVLLGCSLRGRGSAGVSGSPVWGCPDRLGGVLLPYSALRPPGTRC